MIRLYDFPLSGNCHKVRLFMSILGLSWTSETVDVPNGAHHAPWFAAINPLRMIPVIDDDGHIARDSQAILTYLAWRHDPTWLGDTPNERGCVVQWLSFAANEIGNSLQPARLYYLIGEPADIDAVTARSRQVLGLLDAHLAKQNWLAASRPTIADIACLPYVAMARQGKLPLDEYAHVMAWIDRIAAIPGYIAMPGLPEPTASV